MTGSQYQIERRYSIWVLNLLEVEFNFENNKVPGPIQVDLSQAHSFLEPLLLRVGE